MLSKVVCSLLGRAKPVVESRWGNKTRLISLLLIIAILTSCSPGGNPTQVSPTSTTQPQVSNCEATDTGFCWPTGKKVDNGNWLADSCSWSGNDNYFADLYHIGTDILGSEGDAVYAIADGKVFRISSGENSGWLGIKVGKDNKGVLVKHKLADGSDFLALYGHIVTSVKEGDVLTAGQAFAEIGPYDISKPHLHFGIRANTTVPQTNWGRMKCPASEPIIDTNGFAKPIDWITTRSPLGGSVLGATAPALTPTLVSQTTQEKQDILIAEGGKGRLLLVEIPSSKILWQKDGWYGLSCVSVTIDGHILVCESDGITEIDRDGRVIRTLKGAFESVTDVKSVGNNRILVSECGSGKVMEMDWSGNETWSISGLHCALEAVRLANGDTLVADGSPVLRQFNSDGKLTWSTYLSNWANGVKRLSDNTIIVAEYQAVELLNESGNVIWSYKGKYQFNSVEQLPNGFFLVSEVDGGRVFTLSPDGTTIGWSMTGLSFASDAVLLPSTPASSSIELVQSDLSSVLRLLTYAIDKRDLTLIEPLIGNDGTTTAVYATEFDRVGYDNSDVFIPLLSKALGNNSLLCLGYDNSPSYKAAIFFKGNVDWSQFPKRTNEDSSGIVFGFVKEQQHWELMYVTKLPSYVLSYSHEHNCPTFSSASTTTNLALLNRAEYFSVLQWIKYATLNNDISVFEDLIIGNSIQLIDGNNAAVDITKSDFLAELSARLTSKPNCEFFMFEESGRLVVRISNWSPGWGVDGNSIVYLILEMKNNQWVLSSIIFGDHLPSWAKDLERISFDTISLSVGNTEEACVEARPTRLKVGDFAFISFYPPLRQRIRSSYGTANSILELIPVGTAVKILDGPECADNWVWWKIRVLSSKLEGWTSEGDRDAYWLIPCESRENCGTQ